MQEENHEVPLAGGHVNACVLRLGNTVRRAPTPNSGFVRSLLSHLESVGFSGAPRALGGDKNGREIFDFLEGTTPLDLCHHDDAVLTEAAGLIRRYHDATADLVAAPAARKAGIEVVCHNDLSPCNFVFRSGRPVGIIDFDAASPGTRAYDLGYAAWLWLDLGTPDVEPLEQRRRLDLFLNAYGKEGPARSAVVAAMLLRQRILVAEGIRRSDPAMAGWAEYCLGWSMLNLVP